MPKTKKNRTRLVGFGLTDEEYGKLKKNWKASTVKMLSEYLRQVIFHKTIKVRTRNQSLDDFMEEMVVLRAALEKAQEGFELATQKLQQTPQVPGESSDRSNWYQAKHQLLANIVFIKTKIDLIADQWLQ